MEEACIKFGKGMKHTFIDKVKELLPEGGNLSLCLTCGACAAGCPATGLEGMDARKFLRMAALGLDDEISEHPWVWMCSMCGRCMYACPMKINIPALVYEARKLWPREKRPKGILGSCDMALRNMSCSAMGTPEEDFRFVVEDVLEEVRETQPGWEDLQAPIDKKGAYFFLSQNSREPVTEPEEMVPLWKILHLAGADWTYSCTGWGGENYCMFLADDDGWKQITATTLKSAEDLGCKVYLNTECGHSTYSVWMGNQRHKIDTKLEIAPIQIARYFEDKGTQPIRVFLSSSCGGPQVGMALDNVRDDDTVFEIAGIQYLVNKTFLAQAQPIRIDFNNHGFIISSSIEQTGSCGGCGSSDACCSS